MSRILLVYKRSYVERYRDDPRVLANLSKPERMRLRKTDRAHRNSLQSVREELVRRNLTVDVVWRGAISTRKKYDLVVAVGGDGTFFLASHSVGRTPLLGVNSDPNHSLGLHCGADQKTFPQMLDAVLAGRAKITKLNRMTVHVNSRRIPSLVINDVLFAHPSPAEMTRYKLTVDGKREDQRSSGLWIATASGSTAGIFAAGGRRMPFSSRRIQVLAREPYGWPRRPRLVRCTAKRSVEIHSLMAEAGMWIDGSYRQIMLRMGDRIRIQTGAEPLRVVHLDERRRRKLFP